MARENMGTVSLAAKVKSYSAQEEKVQICKTVNLVRRKYL